MNKSFINFNIQNSEKTTSKMWLVVIGIFLCNLIKFGLSMLDKLDASKTCFSSHLTNYDVALDLLSSTIYHVIWLIPILIALWPGLYFHQVVGNITSVGKT